MIPLAVATVPAAGTDTVTLVTGSLLATAAIVSSATPIVLARRRSRKEKLADLTAEAVSKTDLTIAGWTALNGALQQEIRRLQGVQERQQARIDMLEGEIAELQQLALALQRDKPSA